MFDKTQPKDTTKIRNLGAVIRPNFVAIQEAPSSFKPYAINLQNRTPLGVSNDPATISGSSILYTKTDADGKVELFCKSSAGTIQQLTSVGFIGSKTMKGKFANIRFGTNTTDWGINNITTAGLRWTAAGATSASYGCTMTRVATGHYRVTLTTARSNTNYYPMVTLKETGSMRAPFVEITSTTQFEIYVRDENDSKKDVGGFCVVFGGF